MQISTKGINLIKSFESCRLTAYKAVSTEKYYTIGWGHYGADVKKGQTITQAGADALFLNDLVKYEKAVNSYNLTWINQGRYDALVSFAYNCGAGNLKTLLNGGKRTASEVAAKIPAYNKSGGKVLNGLVKRRAKELELFNSDTSTNSTATSTTKAATKTVNYYPACASKYTTIVQGLNSIGVDSSKSNRVKIGAVNGITNVGTVAGNTKMLSLLKAGKLIKP